MNLILRDVWPWAQLQDCLLPPVPVRFHEMLWLGNRTLLMSPQFVRSCPQGSYLVGYLDWRSHAKDFIRLRWIGRGFKLDACWLWEQVLLSNKYIYERNMAHKLRMEIEERRQDWEDTWHGGLYDSSTGPPDY